MNRTPLWSLIIMVLCCGTAALPENASEPTNPPIAMRATHLLGFEGVRDNVNGTLSIQGEALQFRRDRKPGVEIKIDSIQDVFVGEQSREIGGVPMTLGKAATPYGGGRVVSLFAHKKYDTLSVQYMDAGGGLHGAIFQLNKGQGEVFRNELVSHGVHVAGVLPPVAGALPGHVAAHTVETESSAINLSPERWSVQVSKVDPGDVHMDPSFQVAIYENLVDELNKTKRFERVLREGDHRGAGVPNLLTLKTKVEKYTPGSETERAVTTLGGATKLTVRNQLCTADGAVVLKRTMTGNVRFMGSNLRATHNLARHVAKVIQKSSLPEPSHSRKSGGATLTQNRGE